MVASLTPRPARERLLCLTLAAPMFVFLVGFCLPLSASRAGGTPVFHQWLGQRFNNWWTA